MFKLVEFEDTIGIPPSKFNEPLKEAALEVLKELYEGSIIPEIGLIITILDTEVSPIGHIIYGEGNVYHNVIFKALAFSPMEREIVEGEVSVVEEFGLLVRIGPIEGFIHKSQIWDDYFSYNREQNIMLGTKTRRIIRKGDVVRARIVSVSYSIQSHNLRIALTMRQPFLGKKEWIEEQLKGEENAET